MGWGMGWYIQLRRALAVWLLGSALIASALAARVADVSPQGEVAVVRQIAVRFEQAVVPAGDPRLAAPFRLECNGASPAGDGRWADERRWLFDLAKPLPAGVACVLRADPAWAPLPAVGKLEGPTEYRFSTGGPGVLAVQPYPGSQIEEDQHFLLHLNGVALPASVVRGAWCEVEGVGERIAVRVVEGPARDELLRQRRIKPAAAPTWLLLACERPFPAQAGVRLVWGPGIAAAANPKVVTRGERPFQWRVRPRFTAEFSCERERANAACMPLRPVLVRFSSPLSQAAAMAARLQPAGGAAIAPQAPSQPPAPGRDTMVSELRFAAPLPENMRFTLTLPTGLRDEGGRPLANAASFPVEVATAAMPPLAKFSGAPFGIVEAGPQAMLPLTLRHVQADLQGASTGGRVAIKRLDASTSDLTLLQWIARLERFHEQQISARDAGRPAAEWTVVEKEADERGKLREVKRERMIGTREISLLATEPDTRRSELPQVLSDKPAEKPGEKPGATEVLGVPLAQTGYHVVEVESRILGSSLLASRAPMYVRTGALVTNLGVHFKRGRTSSLVWVTTLDRARPAAGARVAVNDCHGKPLWSGLTDARGIATIPRGFDDVYDEKCLGSGGFFVTARQADASGRDDLSFVFSRWNRGIEPWRFNLPTASGASADRRAHTVFDRTLLRTGEVVSMKHFLREETERGLAWPTAVTLPDQLVLSHVGSGEEIELPLAWRSGARSAESRWEIPRAARLGLYETALRRGDKRWPSGSLRVEAFRVPLVDARLSGPAGTLVAPKELPLSVQLNMLAGGPLAKAPLQVSAMLRDRTPEFPGFEDHSFAPPSAVDAVTTAGHDEETPNDGARIVADRLPASTDAQGAATVALKNLPTLKGPSELVAELGFNDPNGELQTATQRLRLWPSAVVVGIRSRNWAASRGEARVSAVVLDTAGRSLKGREVEVSGRLIQTYSARKRIVGGFYAYDNQREVRELGVLCRSMSDAAGRVNCDAAIDVVGEVELVARAKDDAGRVSEAATSVWLTGAGELWFAQDNDDRIDLLPEKREVEPGDTARLQVRMPFHEATALVTVEREGLIDSRVVTLRGRQPVIEMPIPKAIDGSASWAPNVIVSVLVLRGRVREVPWHSIFSWGWRDPADWWRAWRYEGRDFRAPTAMVDLAKPSFKLGVAQLKIGLAAHRLEVRVTPERAQYGVRETVRTKVSVTQGGRPLAGAEIAFAAVDEGLLALQPNRSWDLLEAMMQPRHWGVETATAQGEIIGRRHYGRKALPPGGGGGRNPTRELFDTLLLWRGTVALDARGEALVEVPLNDSLTSFRLVAIADVGVDRFGSGSAVVRVTQDLQLFSGLPPLAREGDRFDAGFTLRNTTARPVEVKLSLSGQVMMGGQQVALTLPAPTRTVNLAAGAASEQRWTAAVPAGAERIEWEVAAESPLARDRLRVTQAVLPAVPVRVWQSTLQRLDGALSLPVAPPTGALPGGGVMASLLPRLGGALPGLRRYFETYPYSCLEQKASKAIALHDAALWATVSGDLATYLDRDGLASFFPPRVEDAARGSDRLTAHLIAAAHEAGLAWPDVSREAMLQGLAAFVEGRVMRSFAAPRADLDVRKLAALEALSRHGRATPDMLGSITLAPATWPTSALLDWWAVLRRVEGIPERAARLDEVQRLLRSRLVLGGGSLRFSTEDSDDWWWLMDGPDGNAARLLLAASEVPGWKDEAPRLMTGLLGRQQRGAWATTTANLWGVLALEKFAQRFESVAVGGRSSLQLGRTQHSVDWVQAPTGASALLPWPVEPAALTASHSGPGQPWLAVQALAAVPLQAPLAAGYRITRTLTAVQRQRPEAWSRGDVLRVRIEVEAAADMAWVVVSDPLPAGAALLGGGLGRDSAMAVRGERREGSGWLAYEERATDAWRAYFEWLPRGRHVVEYTLRLNASGSFGLPPTRVEAMYAPAMFGERPNTLLEVQR